MSSRLADTKVYLDTTLPVSAQFALQNLSTRTFDAYVSLRQTCRRHRIREEQTILGRELGIQLF